MARRYYHLPSLTALNTFDACARHGSFTGAATELGVTLGAVSRQIKGLETDLNCSLFKRRYRGVELTAEGAELHLTVSNSFHQIGTVCRDMRMHGNHSVITVAATTAFATLWLMPRLSSFWQSHQEIELNYAISDNPGDSGFFNADMRIRYGDGRWRGESAVHLFDERIYPVCGEKFYRELRISQIEHIPDNTLLKLDSLDPAWIGWDYWLSALGVSAKIAKYRRFNNYIVALQAAEENQGIALGWHSMVAPLIESRRLRRIGDYEIEAPGAYYLTRDSNRGLSKPADLLLQWLVNECKKYSEN